MENKYFEIRIPQSMSDKISRIWSILQTRFGKLILEFLSQIVLKTLPSAIFNGLFSPHESLYFSTLGMSHKPIEFLVI